MLILQKTKLFLVYYKRFNDTPLTPTKPKKKSKKNSNNSKPPNPSTPPRNDQVRRETLADTDIPEQFVEQIVAYAETPSPKCPDAPKKPR